MTDDERDDETPAPAPAANRQQPPKREKVRPAYLWFLGAAGGTFLALLVLSFQWKDGRRVARVEITGTEIFVGKEARTRTGVATGALLDTVSLRAVRARLEAHPYVRDARVSRSYPDALSVEIDERVPVASFTVKGAVRYVDAEGVVLPYIESAATHDLPTITGVAELASTPLGRQVEGDGTFEALAVLGAAMETDSSVYHLISEVDLRDPDDITLYSAEGGVPIRIGRGDTMRKMSLLRGFWDRFVREAGPENLEYLDLRFGDRVVAKWNRKPQETINHSSM